MRIVQLANLVTPNSGGIRTALTRLGEGYTRLGHERHVIVPAGRERWSLEGGGTTWQVPGVRLPSSGGYRLVVRRHEVLAILERLEPDSIEVSDRYTLTWTAGWARRNGVRSVAFVHDHLAGNLATWLPSERLARRVARRADARLLDAFDEVVCASSHTAGPFGARATIVPLGVDLEHFHPLRRRRSAGRPPHRLLLVGRLSAEKRPGLAVDAVRILVDRGLDVRLEVIGTGPLRTRLEQRSRGLPIRFLGHVADRGELAGLLADGDVSLCPCPIEGFGLGALESLASGTPIVTTGGGPVDLLRKGRPEAGAIVSPTPEALANGVQRLLEAPRCERAQAARFIALGRPWARTVDRMLATHAGTRLVKG